MNETTWEHFREITGCIERIRNNIKQVVRDIGHLKSIKESILDDAEFKAKLKKIIDVYPGATMESLIADYTRFRSLGDWLEENEF